MSNFISLAQAIAMTKKYQAEKENILAPDYKDKGILPFSETFDVGSFKKLVDKTDAKYIRIYLGMGDDLKVRVIAVAADSTNHDILPTTNTALARGDGDDDDDDDDDIVEDGQRCPDICPPEGPLYP